METSVWIVVLCAIAGVCTACDMESITGCARTIETKFDSLNQKYHSTGNTMSEKKYNQKICGHLETYWSCVTPLLSDCPGYKIREKNEWITEKSQYHNCVEPVTISVGTIESTKGVETFTSTKTPPTATRGRHNGGRTTTVDANTGSRTNTWGRVTEDATPRWGRVSTEDATPRWTPWTGKADDATHVSHVATDVTPDAANPAATTVLTGAPTTVSVATRGSGSALLMAGMVTMVTVCMYE